MKNIFKYKLFQRSIVFVLLVSLLMTAMPVYAISSSNTPELNETTGTNEIDDNTIEQGASTAVGFLDSIGCGTANNWTSEFFRLIEAGFTVQGACDMLANDLYPHMDSYVICGYKHATLC